MTTYAARHVALEGDDSEPEGLASSWGDSPAPRRAMVPEPVTAYQAYEPEPELVPFATVAQQESPFQRTAPSEFGEPVVALAPSQAMQWHLTSDSNAPLDPGPVDAAAPLSGPAVDPASVPTPVSAFGAFAYQSMPSPSPYTSVLSPAPYPPAPPVTYASMPAQGTLTAPLASPYANPVPGPYQATTTPDIGQGIADVIVAASQRTSGTMSLTGLGRMMGTAQRIYGLLVVAGSLAVFTLAGFMMGGQVWWMVALAWLAGLFMIVKLLGRRTRLT